MSLCCFRESGNLVCADGVQITEWDASSMQPVARTVLDVGSHATVSSMTAYDEPQQGGKRRRPGSGSSSVVLGLSDGRIGVLDLASGSINWLVDSAAAGAGRVMSLALVGSSVYAACQSSKVAPGWHLPAGTPRKAAKNGGKVPRIAASFRGDTDGDHLLLASNYISVASTTGGRVASLRGLAGMCTAVTAVRLDDDSSVVVAASDRSLMVWSVDLSGGPVSGGKTAPKVFSVATTSLRSPCVAIDAAPASGSAVLVSVTLQDGSAEVLQLTLTEEEADQADGAGWAIAAARVTLQPGSGSEATPVLGTRLQASVGEAGEEGTLRLFAALGSRSAPVVAALPLPAAHAAFQGRSIQTAHLAGVAAAGPGAAGGADEEEEAAGLKTGGRAAAAGAVPNLAVGRFPGAHTQIEQDQEPTAEEADEGDDESMSDRSAKRSRAATVDLDEPSLADKLRKLAGALQRAPTAEDGATAAAGAGSGGVGSLEGAASSMATVLEQALRAGDNTRIELVIARVKEGDIGQTVSGIPAGLVLPLLRWLVAKFEKKPARSLALVAWIKAVLVHHAAQLLNTPRLVNHLASLYQTLDARLAPFRKMLRLSGRLDLVLSQLSAQGADAASTVQRQHATTVQIDL